VEAKQALGRTRELERLGRFLAGAHEGFGTLVIAGEAGIGKTTLWEEALGEADGRGSVVLRCRAAEQEETLAYVGLGDLLAPSAPRLSRLPRLQREALESALLLTRKGAPNQRTVGLAVLATLRMHAEEQPTVVAIDDAHWLDRSSVRALHFALSRLSNEHLRLLLTVRSGIEAPLLQRPLVRAQPEELLLGPLDERELEAVIERTLGTSLLKPALHQLHDVSGGNPFFALEIAKEALRTGRRLTSAELPPIPSDLRKLVSARISRLDPTTRELLVIVAAVVRPTATLLERVLGADARAHLAQALEADVLVFEQGHLRFSHPLLASTVYASSPPAERRRVHLRLAGSVDDTEERGRHLALGTEIPDRSVAAALDEAATAARGRGATEAAALLTEHALRLTPPEDEARLTQRALDAADSLFLIGETERSRAVVAEVASRMPAGPSRARIFRRLARARGYTAGFAATETLLTRALADAGSDLLTRALLEHDLGEALQQYGHLDEAMPHCDAALTLAEQLGDTELVRKAQLTRDVLCFMRGQGLPVGFAERDLAFPANLLRASGNGEPRFLDEFQVSAVMLKYSDHVGAARELLERLRTSMLAEGREGVVAPVLFQLAELECWAGNLQVSRRLTRELVRTLARSGQEGMRLRAAYATALVHAHAGRLDLARRIATSHLRLAESTGDFFLTIRLHALLGFVALSAGDGASTAAAHLRQASALSEAAGYGEPGVVRYAGDEIEALLLCDDVDAARGSLQRLEFRGRKLDRPWAIAVAGRCQALLAAAAGDLDRAVETALVTIPLHDRVKQPLERGRTLMTLGILYRRSKRRRESREALTAALDIFASIGATAWSTHTRAEIERISGRKTRPTGLSPTEQQVAELAAAGRTNKEIAAEIHLSVKAVEANLSRVYAKLTVRSRSELTARLVGFTASDMTP
jgi:DNA-binding CsgD family transcriptional regulator